MLPGVRRVLSPLKWAAHRRLRPLACQLGLVKPNLHVPDATFRYTYHGTPNGGGGWPLVDGAISKASIIYSIGVGDDASFDQAIISKFGSHVHAFDPTPRSIEWVSQQVMPLNFYFHPLGIAATDGEVKLFPPAKAQKVSYSIAPNINQGDAPCVCRVLRLTSIMKLLGHARVDVLKMDIEGFEYQVIDDLLAGDIRPQHLLIEFHHDMYQCSRAKTVDAVAAIKSAGYKLFYVSYVGREYGFFRPGQGRDTAIGSTRMPSMGADGSPAWP